LSGGQGHTWSADDIVLKPADELVEASWVASTLSTLPEAGFRLARPVRSRARTCTVSGWTAWTKVSGAHDVSARWHDVLRVGQSFHAMLAAVPRPPFLDYREDVWSMGDRAAWNDRVPRAVNPAFAPLLTALQERRSPSALASQVVHGDLTGNVLFAEGADPAVIDFVPYWRPAEFAAAVVVVDAVAWHGAPFELLRALDPRRERLSMLARAAIYRLVTSDLAAAGQADASAYVRRNVAAHERVLRAMQSL
jgi:uncharacterized protein (TIGR02569 family)